MVTSVDTVPKPQVGTQPLSSAVESCHYEALGDIAAALNHIDQAQAEYPRHSTTWTALGNIYRQLAAIDLEPETPCLSTFCYLDGHNECPDTEGNCCDCSCHLDSAIGGAR